MSHFTVAVITRENPNESDIIEKMLAPYDENLRVAPHIHETRAQWLEKKRKELEDYKNDGPYSEWVADPVTYEARCSNNQGHINYVRNFMDVYNKTDEELIAEREADEAKWNDENLEYGEAYIDKDGNYICSWNEQGNWDWYSIGGRWNGGLPLISEKDIPEENRIGANVAQIKDIDFGVDIDIEKLTKDADIIAQYNKIITEGDGWYRVEYLQKRYPTIEDFIKNKYFYSTFAVVDQNGIWYEKGKMGWFAMSSDTPEDAINWTNNFYETFFKDVNPEWYVTLVDCHI